MTQEKEPIDDGSAQINEKKTGLDRLKRRLFRPGILITLFAAVLAALGVTIYLLVTNTPPPPVVLEGKESTLLQAVSPQSDSRAYEEAFGGLEEQVRQVDFALLEALRTSGIDMQQLQLNEVLVRKHEGQDYHFQRLRIPQVKNRDSFLLAFQQSLATRIPQAFLSGESGHILVRIDGVNTHDILLAKGVEPQSIEKKVENTGPKLVVVIDDVGENMKVLKGLLSIDLPIVYAVWPASSHMSESVGLIRKSNREMLVHFPMQPQGYPHVDPGEGALFVKMNAKQIKATVRRYATMVSGAIGVNNHMGSKFTENKPGMRVALKEFKRLGLFFLDSMTTPNSVGRSVARSISIPFYKRNVFLDNVKDVSAIVHQLRKAERLALSRGHAIAIGHPHPATLAALRQWATHRSKRVSVIPISKLKPEFASP